MLWISFGSLHHNLWHAVNVSFGSLHHSMWHAMIVSFGSLHHSLWHAMNVSGCCCLAKSCCTVKRLPFTCTCYMWYTAHVISFLRAGDGGLFLSHFKKKKIKQFVLCWGITGERNEFLHFDYSRTLSHFGYMTHKNDHYFFVVFSIWSGFLCFLLWLTFFCVCG